MEFTNSFFYSVEDYSLDFGKTTHPIMPVSFELKEGDVAIVEWKSKYLGKTSFIEGLSGLHDNIFGKISVNNKDISKLNREEKHRFRSNSSIIFQKPALITNLTVRENIALPLEYHNTKKYGTVLSKEEINKKTTAMMEEFNLLEHQNKLPESLTLDQSKIASFARTLIREPKLLFLDNPTSTVSEEGFNMFFNVALEKIINNKKMIVVALLTQNPRIIEKLSPNIEIVISDI